MKVGIDARFLGPDGTGIGRYVEKLLENLEILDKKNEYFVFLRKSNFPLYNPKNKKFTKVTVDAHWYSIKEQVLFPAALRKLKLDLVHFPHFNIPLLYSGDFIVTIHDLTKSKFASLASRRKLLPIRWSRYLVYNLTISQALTRAKRILVPSNFVKKELVEFSKIDPAKIEVTYEAATEFGGTKTIVSEGKIKEIYHKFGIKEPFILYIGNNYPYKNVGVIIEALTKIDPSIKFVCVSPRNQFLEQLGEKAQNLGVKDRFITTGFLGDEELKILFSKGLGFIFPSLSEGFGLPGLEAMSAGCPVIAAKSSSLPEVYGDAALYFKPNSVSDLSEKINLLFKNENVRSQFKELGRKQVKKYSWKKMAQQTLEVYEQILKK